MSKETQIQPASPVGNSMQEIDFFAELIRVKGEPERAIKVSKKEASMYRGRVPDALLRFWQEHGRGSYDNGTYWICDPGPFQPVIEAIFRFDPQYDPAEMTAVGYDAFGTLWVWHRRHHGVTAHLQIGSVFGADAEFNINPDTGKIFSDDVLIGGFLTNFMEFDPVLDDQELELMPQAIARLGRLEENEVYGHVPALALGGQVQAENMQKFNAPAQMIFLASLMQLVWVDLSPPEEGYPSGRLVALRKVGPQH